jgi:hypothetical protein
MIGFNFVMYMKGKVVASGDITYLPRIGETIVCCGIKFRVTDIEHCWQKGQNDRVEVNIIVEAI